MRISILLSLCATVLTLTSCNDSGTPVSATVPPPAGWPIVYAAVGGSDVIGVGSSRPCPLFDDCNGNGYPWVAARRLAAAGYAMTVVPSGIPGAVAGPALRDLAIQAGRTDVADTLSVSALARVRQTNSLVTLASGAQDLNVILSAIDRGLGGADAAAFVDRQAAVFAGEFGALRRGARENAPGARLVVINLPNLAAFPYLAAAPPARRQLAQRAAVAMSAAMNSTSDAVRVIDLMCDSRFYQPAAFGADGFHLSDAGHDMLGAAIAEALTAATYPAPRTSCPQMTIY